MTKRLIIYIAIVAALTGLGIAVSIIAFGEKAAGVLPSAGLENRADSAQKQNPIKPLPAKPGSQGVSGPKVGDSVKVVSIMGSALKSNTKGGEWSDLSAGEYLVAEDRIKTDDNSKITLRVGEKSLIELAERAEISVGRTSPEDRSFKLVRGRVSVDYQEKDKRLRIENEDGSATAETEEGIFTVLNTGATVAVATKTGSVDLISGGERVSVLAGQQSVSSGNSPSRPAPIPVDVMLRVVDPGCRVQREKYIVLKGRTSVGAAVFANGNPAEIQPDGQFSVKVPLKTGNNNISVVTEDVFGNRSKRNFPCVTVDPGAPIEKIDIRWGPSGGREAS